ncbi:hypothetical protein CJ260_11500 [Megasphaera sp. ASD88]|uniref:putative phage tail protein n=1 Tax=Megasphaera sp. ASD88 TaxID=2027407 RepID=UPI000BAB7CED|nr:putative phage tail protein [Megasphaera sp. ASD88]PAV38005.1 hypothetical protein CJ260_11500 [Megasphaera sp. ASD88]
MDDLTRVISLATFLPPVTRDSKDVQELMRIEDTELQALWEAMCDIFYNQFISTMTAYGLQQWEKIFDVMPKATDTLQDRRTRILQLLMGTRPYTVLSFQAILDNIYGPGNVTIHVDNDKYEFWMELTADMMSKNISIREFAETIVPKNLLILISNTQNAALRQYTDGHVRQQSVVSIAGYTGVNIGDMTAAQYTGGYVHVLKTVNVGG